MHKWALWDLFVVHSLLLRSLCKSQPLIIFTEQQASYSNSFHISCCHFSQHTCSLWVEVIESRSDVHVVSRMGCNWSLETWKEMHVVVRFRYRLWPSLWHYSMSSSIPWEVQVIPELTYMNSLNQYACSLSIDVHVLSDFQSSISVHVRLDRVTNIKRINKLFIAVSSVNCTLRIHWLGKRLKTSWYGFITVICWS